MNRNPEIDNAVDLLLRQNAGQMVAVLTRIFGFEHIDQIEDAIQEALLRALHNWAINGVPENPTAWLIQVAKNKLLDQLRRDNKSVDLNDETRLTEKYVKLADDPVFFSDEISDDQLRMIFACCHPSIPKDSQVAITLKTVGGFNNREIASAFLAKKTAIDKILVRAKSRLKKHRDEFEMPQPDMVPERLEAVLKVLYLMFNEGYMASEGDELIRKDLCFEAIRLTKFLARHPLTSRPKVNALTALFLFQASRLSARCEENGALILLSDQDRSTWDQTLIADGLRHFRRSGAGDELSDYHLEAEIASFHVIAPSFEQTNWVAMLESYEELYKRRPSPIVALNKAFAMGKVQGPEAALSDLETLKNKGLETYFPFHLTSAEFYEQTGRLAEAANSYDSALRLTSNIFVKKFVEKKLSRVS